MACGFCETAEMVKRGEVTSDHAWGAWMRRCQCDDIMSTKDRLLTLGNGPCRRPALPAWDWLPARHASRPAELCESTP